MDENYPSPGWHHNMCSKCGEIASKTTHFNGKREIICDWCPPPTICIRCFIKSENVTELSILEQQLRAAVEALEKIVGLNRTGRSLKIAIETLATIKNIKWESK